MKTNLLLRRAMFVITVVALAVGAGMAFGQDSSSGEPTGASVSSGIITRLDPVADAWINSTYPNTNYQGRLSIGGNVCPDLPGTMYDQAESLLRFNLSSIPPEAAIESAYKMLDRVEDFCNDGWCMVGVVVKAYLLADEDYEDDLGEASVWGNESDMDAESFCDVAKDLAHEAASEARKHVERLYERIGQQKFAFLEDP